MTRLVPSVPQTDIFLTKVDSGGRGGCGTPRPDHADRVSADVMHLDQADGVRVAADHEPVDSAGGTSAP
jgi:hypothetical protein